MEEMQERKLKEVVEGGNPEASQRMKLEGECQEMLE